MHSFFRKSVLGSALVSSLMLGFQRVAFAATCSLNGEDIPCDQLAGTATRAIGLGFGFIVLVFGLMIAMSIFWILMIVHAATKPIENKAVWIVIMVLTGIIGAIAYYFAVKRTFKEGMAPMNPSMPNLPPTPPAVPPTTPPAQS